MLFFLVFIIVVFLIGLFWKHNLMPQPIRSRYTDASDRLILEDELQRIALVGDNLSCHHFVTGDYLYLLLSCFPYTPTLLAAELLSLHTVFICC